MGIVGGEGIHLEQKEREREVTEEGTTAQCFHLHSSLISSVLCVTVCPRSSCTQQKTIPTTHCTLCWRWVMRRRMMSIRCGATSVVAGRLRADGQAQREEAGGVTPWMR